MASYTHNNLKENISHPKSGDKLIFGTQQSDTEARMLKKKADVNTKELVKYSTVWITGCKSK